MDRMGSLWLFGNFVGTYNGLFFAEFHDSGHFKRTLNSTFIVLIPKKGGTNDLKDFRLIS